MYWTIKPWEIAFFFAVAFGVSACTGALALKACQKYPIHISVGDSK